MGCQVRIYLWLMWEEVTLGCLHTSGCMDGTSGASIYVINVGRGNIVMYTMVAAWVGRQVRIHVYLIWEGVHWDIHTCSCMDVMSGEDICMIDGVR